MKHLNGSFGTAAMYCLNIAAGFWTINPFTCGEINTDGQFNFCPTDVKIYLFFTCFFSSTVPKACINIESSWSLLFSLSSFKMVWVSREQNSKWKLCARSTAKCLLLWHVTEPAPGWLLVSRLIVFRLELISRNLETFLLKTTLVWFSKMSIAPNSYFAKSLWHSGGRSTTFKKRKNNKKKWTLVNACSILNAGLGFQGECLFQ